MTRPGVAVVPSLMERFAPLLHDRFELHAVGGPAAEGPGTARALVTSGGIGAGAALIASLPALEIIAVDGVGWDAVDLEAARRRNIRVTNTPGVLTEDVADLAIGLIIAVHRQMCAADAFVRNGDWQEGQMALGRRASGRRLGIAGMGRIGSAIARRAVPMMKSIAYTGRRPRPGAGHRYVTGLEALAADSDILVLAVPGGPETTGIVDRDVLRALGPEGVLINVARGSVVDEAALVKALASGALGGAGLDVFSDEPRVPAALLGMPNVVLQPHRGSATRETRAEMAQLVVDNLIAHFGGRPLPTPVP